MPKGAMNKTITLDVRDDIRKGREPLSKIMRAAAVLQSGEDLLVIAPFEPAPLFAVLEKQGFRHLSRPLATGDWEVRFTSESLASPPAVIASGASRVSSRDASLQPVEIMEVDARGLEPPQPLINILETLAQLPVGGQLTARTDRRPMHLYAQLEERGFTAESQEQPDGSFLTHVRRR
jgi:uncharacterized protein (DUF2249 family)